MSPETIGVIAGGGFAIINVSVFWVREWRKHRTWSKNGIALNEIKSNMKHVKEKVDRVRIDITKIKTRQEEQTKACDKTVTRFDAAILKNQGQLLEIAKDK